MKWELYSINVSSGCLLQRTVHAFSWRRWWRLHEVLWGQTKNCDTANWGTANLLMRRRGNVYSCFVTDVRRNLRRSGNT